MSELKHNFIQGRMNKDLDERLVPNGEYRDATNIQVSTSEDSEVGTIQNILGNVLVDDYVDGLYPDKATCIASISDEKNDSLYFFVQDKSELEEQVLDLSIQSTPVNYYFKRDLIIEYKQSSDPLSPGVLEPVFVDTYFAFAHMHPSLVYKGSWGENTYTITIPTDADALQTTPVIKPGMEVVVIDTSSGSPTASVGGQVVESSVNSQFLNGVLNAEPYIAITLSKNITAANLTNMFFVFYSPKVLFPWDANDVKQKYITGVNIIDDLLFWTDNVGEPKKINIKDSKRGTKVVPGLPPYSTCLAHAEQHNYNYSLSSWVASYYTAEFAVKPVEEQHITVIKKSPKTPPTIQTLTARDNDYGVGAADTFSGLIKITTLLNQSQSSFLEQDGSTPSTDHWDFTSVSIGETIYLSIGEDLALNNAFEFESWGENFALGQNQAVVLKEYSNSSAQPAVPITNYRIKGVIVGWDDPSNAGTDLNLFQSTSAQPARVAIKIVSIDGFPPTPIQPETERYYVIDSYSEVEKLFEFRFPRFAYRWKYKDGEYSTYSPFSEVAFKPGGFDYHPRKGYNLGMTNTIDSVRVYNWFNKLETPDDVVEIDLLYKDEQGTNIYVVKTIKVSDQFTDQYGFEHNYWDWNSFKISSETIQSIVPSNQLLRPYDNVPRKALAQEVVGNRIVYGNYTQNFDLIDSVTEENTFSLTGHDFTVAANTVGYSSKGTRSIKSLREYQLGVVFADEYDRQTPVISNASSTTKIDKSYSWSANSFDVKFSQSYPLNMVNFKFFIKETADEYYNMAMDRFYDAEDGNIWLAFASSDRNKVDIDTFLLLKKGLDDNVQVLESARYKVLAIDNEAPDYIKTTKLLVSKETQNANSNDIFGSTMADAPGVSDDGFSANYDVFINTSGADLDKIDVSDKLYVEFGRAGVDQVSNRYEITRLTSDWNGDVATLSSAKYHFKIKGVFKSDIAFITDDDTGFNSTHVEDGATISIYKYRVENRPQFDGRFFVKILSDDTFSKYVKIVTQTISSPYKVVTSQKTYKLPSDFSDPLWASTSSATYPGFDPDGLTHNNLAVYKTQFKSWFQEFKFLNDDTYVGNATSGPLIDAGTQSTHNFDEGFCETAYGWTMYNHCVVGGSPNQPSNWGAPNEVAPPAYWFIDEGIYRGYSINNDIDSRYTSIQPSDAVFRFSDDDTYDLNNNGLEPLPLGGDGYDFNLGFGGVWSKSWEWSGTADFYQPSEPGVGTALNQDTAGTAELLHYETIPGFFNIGSPGGNPNHLNQKNMVSKLVPGQRFRWREDPNKTEYTVGLVEHQQLIRYRRNDESMEGYHDVGAGGMKGSWETGSSGPAGYLPTVIDAAACHDTPFGTSEKINTDFTNPANFTKNWKMSITPALTWDPTTGTGGLIDGGLLLELTTPTSGNTCYACDAGAGPITPGLFRLVLNSILTQDAAGNEIQLTQGMALWKYTSSGVTIDLSTSANQIMVIKNIDYDALADEYLVYLAGTEKIHTVGDSFVPSNNSTLHFGQPVMNGFSPQLIENYQFNTLKGTDLLMDAVGYTLEFIEPIDEVEIMPEDPAVWETEPKENTALDIYYEASGSLPITLDVNSVRGLMAANQPGAMAFYYLGITGNSHEFGFVRSEVNSTSGQEIDLVLRQNNGSSDLCIEPTGCFDSGGTAIPYSSISSQSVVIHSHDMDIHLPIINAAGSYTDSSGDARAKGVVVSTNLFTSAEFKLKWYNCYTFGNGVESNRIRDNYNLPFIKNGVKVSTTLAGQYKEEDRKYGLIYSGIYNSISGVNNLNQFIQAEKITKDINPSYGSIQKLFTRDSDLVTLCEDRVLKILANKDAVFNADGNPQLTATNNVLGQTIPFSGDYGISTNPESFASQAYRIYFTDRVRGSVMRLSRDGLTPISDHGMKDWFRDKMKLTSTLDNPNILGSYDDRQQEYNVTFDPSHNHAGYIPQVGGWKSSIPFEQNLFKMEQPITVSFKESARGWVSFKSFVPEHAISANSDYFTFKNGRAWKHNMPVIDPVSRDVINYNTFYGEDNFFNSTFNVLLNEAPGIVKSFKTLNYEGSQSKSIKNIQDSEYHNLIAKKGWFVDNMFTDKEEGSLKEFIEKEGKWFNYITGKAINTSDYGRLIDGFDASAFAIQGLGFQSERPIINGAAGCMDDGGITNLDVFGNGTNIEGVYENPANPGTAAFNYDPNVTISVPSLCVAVIEGCLDASASNYDASANTNDDSCTILGCTDTLAVNYDSNANVDDGSCSYNLWGCTDDTALNYNPLATNNDGSCYPYIYGCMDPTAFNYNNGFPFAGNPLTDVNTACCTLCDGTDNNNCCVAIVNGCTDSLACNYDNTANTYDGSCLLCGDATANNLDGADCNDGCEYCEASWDDATSSETLTQTSSTADSITIQWVVPTVSPQTSGLAATVITYLIDASSLSAPAYSTTVNAAAPGTTMSHTITGLTLNQFYSIKLQAVCSEVDGVIAEISGQTDSGILGCTDNTGTNTSLGAVGMTPVNTYGSMTTWGACNYNSLATIDDGSCFYDQCAGCIQNTYTQYCGDCWDATNLIAVASGGSAYTADDGSCSTIIVNGCTDPTATNFDSTANVDDGTCCFVVGCTDPCANNYDAAACEPCVGCCTYGELCDPTFQFVNGQGDWVVIGLDANFGSVNSDDDDLNLNGLRWGLSLPNFFPIYAIDAQWVQGLLPGLPPSFPCKWYKYHTNSDENDDDDPEWGDTWNNQGPIAFASTGKILFEPADVDSGSLTAETSTGIYQAFDGGTRDSDGYSDTFQLTLVVDNWQGSGPGWAPARPDGSFQFLICDGDYKYGDTSTHTTANTTYSLAPGCYMIQNGVYQEFPIQQMANHESSPGVQVTGAANHMPDGVTWSGNANAACSGVGSCTGTGAGTFTTKNYNNDSESKEVVLAFEGLGPNTIIYVGYTGEADFYDNDGDRAYTSSMDLWLTTGSHSSKAAEVSKIEVVNLTNPCGGTGGGGGPAGGGGGGPAGGGGPSTL